MEIIGGTAEAVLFVKEARLKPLMNMTQQDDSYNIMSYHNNNRCINNNNLKYKF